MTHHTHAVAGQKKFQISGAIKALFGVSALAGIALFALALTKDPQRAWPNFLLNYFFFLSLALAGAFFTALQHVTNAYWSVTVRRVAESFMSYLPIAAVLAVGLFLARHSLWEWTHHHVMTTDPILKLKTAYLNTPFFLVRLVAAFAVFIGLGYWIRCNSLKQDGSGDPKLTLLNIKLSTAFLPLFGVMYTLLSFDLLMSLEPHWFSTIFGVYCFAGPFYSGLSLLAVIMIKGRCAGIFSDAIANKNHLHDIAKLMFAFTVFWAYIMFSQLMLQWYANLPEETTYYIRRFHGGWWNFSIALFVLHFVIPFFGLLKREFKRWEGYLCKMAVLMLIAQWLDVYYMVMPPFFKNGPVFGWIEIGTFLGFFGLFGISVGRFLEKHPAIPTKDPRLEQCLAHSQ